MVVLRRRLRHVFLLAAMLALLFFINASQLRTLLTPEDGGGECGGARQPCFHPHLAAPPAEGVEPSGARWPPECPGQAFQAWRLLELLQLSLQEPDDVLLEPYLQSWEQLLSFMEALGSVVSFFSQKVQEKVELLRERSLRRQLQPSLSVRSLVEVEVQEGVVSFSRPSESGCRALLRLHRSLLWLQLLLEGLSRGPDLQGRLRTPGELSRDAYRVALAPHHPWLLRQAAEVAFLALPDRQYFLELVCVRSQEEATPILHVLIRTLAHVHNRTQHILAEKRMLDLP